MESNSLEVKCMLCQNIIILEGEDHLSQFEDHISDHHGVMFNAEFIYIASVLNTEERIDAVIAANRETDTETKESVKNNKCKEDNKKITERNTRPPCIHWD